jgi:succinylglutamic semialdehyde dehydrogenase
MHIEEVEAIWSRIDEADDWSALHDKLAAVRRMGEADAQLENSTSGMNGGDVRTLTSIEPATGATLWTGAAGDRDAEVADARRLAGWAAKPLAFRVETLRRFANVVAQEDRAFADLIARETGKPLWEARTEVEAVINKVDISVSAYADRTSQRRLEGAMSARVAVRHKPHGVLAVLGPYNFPAHLPNGHIVPALIAGNALVFKPSEKTPAVGEFLTGLYHEAGVPEGVVRCVQGGPDVGKALAANPGLDGLLFTGSARAGLRSTASSPTPRRRSSRSKWAATTRW